jgi:hypothetical protein
MDPSSALVFLVGDATTETQAFITAQPQKSTLLGRRGKLRIGHISAGILGRRGNAPQGGVAILERQISE